GETHSEITSLSHPPKPAPREPAFFIHLPATFTASASELTRVCVLSARDMNTTGQRTPHSTPPKRQSAVYMIAFTVRFAESKFGNNITSAEPTTGPPIRFLSAASAV